MSVSKGRGSGFIWCFQKRETPRGLSWICGRGCVTGFTLEPVDPKWNWGLMRRRETVGEFNTEH
jgi:hypothetical protein